MSLVYGEIAFVPFKVVLDVLKRWHHVLKKPGGTFLDIGSGSGKAVFAAALLHDFDACYGIEVLEGLHGISQEVLQRWEKLIKPNFALSMQKKRTRITFTQGDALVVDWPANVDLVFLNSTCFGERLMHALARKLALCCKSGAIVITATHKLPDAQNFVELRQLTVTQEAWGDATWYLHRRNEVNTGKWAKGLSLSECTRCITESSSNTAAYGYVHRLFDFRLSPKLRGSYCAAVVIVEWRRLQLFNRWSGCVHTSDT